MWECRKCHERHEDAFEVCWSCGTAIDGTQDPTFQCAEDDNGPAVLADLAEPSQPPVRKSTCPNCRGTEIMHGVRLFAVDFNVCHDLQAEVCENPSALLMKGSRRGNLFASVCGACGYTELYVTNAPALLAAYQHAQRHVSAKHA